MARSDMFLKVTGSRTGDIKGESRDKGFPDQIQLVDWKWGMTAPTAIGGARTARVQMREFTIVKNADRASTALMNALRANETLSLVLSVRKSGGAPIVYFTATVDDARVTNFEIQSGLSEDGAPVLIEHLTLTYKTVAIDYTPQDSDGKALGASNFTATASPD